MLITRFLAFVYFEERKLYETYEISNSLYD